MTNSENNNNGEDQEQPVLTVEEEVQDKIERIKRKELQEQPWMFSIVNTDV